MALRVLVGGAFGAVSPIETSSPVVLVEARTRARAGEVTLEASAGRCAVFFAEGFGAVDGYRVGVGTLLVLRDGEASVLRIEANGIVLVFGGTPLGRRLLQGNVIGSSVERLEQALREQSSVGRRDHSQAR